MSQFVRISTNSTSPEINDHLSLQLGVIIFGLVFIKKKITKPKFFLQKPKPNRNWFKPTGFGLVHFVF
jgi:hypothetical protein